MSTHALMRECCIRFRMYSAIVVVWTLILVVGWLGLYGLVHNDHTGQAYEQASFSNVGARPLMRGAIGHRRVQEKVMVQLAGDAEAVQHAAQRRREALTQLRGGGARTKTIPWCTPC